MQQSEQQVAAVAEAAAKKHEFTRHGSQKYRVRQRQEAGGLVVATPREGFNKTQLANAFLRRCGVDQN